MIRFHVLNCGLVGMLLSVAIIGCKIVASWIPNVCRIDRDNVVYHRRVAGRFSFGCPFQPQ